MTNTPIPFNSYLWKKITGMRSALVLIVVLVAVFLVFRFCNSRPEHVEEQRQAPLSVSQNTGPFNQSFSQLLNAYYTLTDAFVAADTVRINSAARTLRQRADSLRIRDIQGDSTGAIRETAGSFSTTIAGSASAIGSERDIEAKRRELNVITDALWSLTRTVKYNGEKIFYQHCPMAFKEQGAYWLSSSAAIRNPYMGSDMRSCGEVADSVDYSKR